MAVCLRGQPDVRSGVRRRTRPSARDGDIAGRVHFAGPLTAADLDAAYAAADLLVLASRAETYGMVVTEGLARGLPVVATSVGGLPSALGRGADGSRPGLLVCPATLQPRRRTALLADGRRAAAAPTRCGQRAPRPTAGLAGHVASDRPRAGRGGGMTAGTVGVKVNSMGGARTSLQGQTAREAADARASTPVSWGWAAAMSRRWWSWARPLGGAAILAVLLHQVGTEPFLDAARMIDGWSLAAAAGISALTTVCCAWRWSLVARGLGLGLPLHVAIAAYYRSQFLNTTLPGGVLGDVSRAVRHGRASATLPGACAPWSGNAPPDRPCRSC